VIGPGTSLGFCSFLVQIGSSNSTNFSFSGNFLVLGDPKVFGSSPQIGYIGSVITVNGLNFITLQQDSAALCRSTVGGVLSASCLLLNATAVVLSIGNGTSLGPNNVSLTLVT
jgi:hypothetical protein